ncbi:MAG: hypothetical protein WAL22_22505 [Solirubrobacteraceae bacterium]
MTDAAAFRAQFPILERKAYMNAGTEGPLPRQAADAVRERIEFELTTGRAGKEYIESVANWRPSCVRATRGRCTPTPPMSR